MTDASGNRYYLHYDQVGSLRAVSDSSHNIVKEITYDTYGNILSDSNPNFRVPFGFAGGLYDPDTKLTHFGFREYDAFTGKWTAKDPILFAGGDSNLYGYVLGDPVDLVDPEGLWIPQVIGALIGGGVEWRQNGFGWNVAVGAVTGALGGFGSTAMRAMFFGAAANTLNDLYHQTNSSCKAINWEELGKSSVSGAAGGFIGVRLGRIGEHIKDYSRATPTITNIKYPTIRWDGPIGNYGRSGAAVGAIFGGVVANGGLSW